MSVQEINNFILHYLENDRTRTAIMLTGEWGSGKSHYIENELVPFLQQERKNACVVVSLYGIDNVADISRSIYMEIRMHTFSNLKQSESITAGKVIAKTIFQSITEKIGISVNILDDDIREIYKSIDLDGKLIILEDFERSNIETKKLLGFVNSLVERDGVKVLLVANEKELLKQRIKGNTSSKMNGEESEQYIQIKEKTISDTISFTEPLNDAVKSIVKKFNNQKINQLLDDKMLADLVKIVQNNCKRNLRTFIFAVQKTCDIYEKMLEENQYEDDFYKCIFEGILYFSSKIKAERSPEWQGTQCLSTELGSNAMPLMRFAYDYIVKQAFNLEQVKAGYEEYKKYRFYENKANINDPDLMVLKNFLNETEQNVLNALKSIEKKLENQECIGIYAYSVLAYFMTYVAKVVNFDSVKAQKLMIENLKGKGEEMEFESKLLFLNTYAIEEPDINEQYKELIAEMLNSIDYKKEINFSYNPMDLEGLYNNLGKDSNYLIDKINVSKAVEMLRKSTSEQMHYFRKIILYMFESGDDKYIKVTDKENLVKLFQAVEKLKDEENNWDKIQQLQIDYLISDLSQFIGKIY